MNSHSFIHCPRGICEPPSSQGWSILKQTQVPNFPFFCQTVPKQASLPFSLGNTFIGAIARSAHRQNALVLHQLRAILMGQCTLLGQLLNSVTTPLATADPSPISVHALCPPLLLGPLQPGFHLPCSMCTALQDHQGPPVPKGTDGWRSYLEQRSAGRPCRTPFSQVFFLIFSIAALLCFCFHPSSAPSGSLCKLLTFHLSLQLSFLRARLPRPHSRQAHQPYYSHMSLLGQLAYLINHLSKSSNSTYPKPNST